MSNTVFDNRVIGAKATDLLITKLNARNFMTIDRTLTEHEGMYKTINTYKYHGTVEALSPGQGNTAATRGYVDHISNDYRVQCLQQAYDYLDEDYLKDNNVVDVSTKGSAEEMVNKMTTAFYGALETEKAGEKMLPSFTFANGGSLNYDVLVDAIAEMNFEDETPFFLIIPNKWKASIRKSTDFKACMLGEVIIKGQIGTLCGIPVVPTKATTNVAYLMSKECVTLFIKREVQVEQERDADTRTNSVYLREYYIAAITDATKGLRIGQAQATTATITTYTAAAKTVAGAATTGAKVSVYINGEKDGNDVTASSSTYTFTATNNLASGDKVMVVAKKDGFIESVAKVTVA